MRIPAILLVSALLQHNASGQCACHFAWSGPADTLAFSNTSTLANAHYFWNFGDGTGSNDIHPVHVFPASGHYLVTLYGRDTLTACHDYHEEWIDVLKPSADPCVPMITDSVFTAWDPYENSVMEYIMVSDLSTNCGDYNCSNSDGPSSGGGSFGGWFPLGGWTPGLYLGRVEYSTFDSVDGYLLHQAYQITSPAWFDRAVNYDDCSANFEVVADYQEDGALVTFTAMSPSGVDSFFVIGFGQVPELAGHSVSYLYPYLPYASEFSWIVGHGNYADECTNIAYQQIAIRNPYFAPPVSCAITTQPQPVTAILGGTAKFIIETQEGSTKQWQQDAGLGWQDLTNAGPFSGVHTDTLTIAEIQSWWNNNQYRCVVSDPLSNCHNTSGAAALITAVGMEEVGRAEFQLYPVPAGDRLSALFDERMAGATATIRDMHGRLLRTWVIRALRTELDLGALAGGMYLFEVQDGVNLQRTRFMKQ